MARNRVQGIFGPKEEVVGTAVPATVRVEGLDFSGHNQPEEKIHADPEPKKSRSQEGKTDARIKHNTVYRPELVAQIERIAFEMHQRTGKKVYFYTIVEEGMQLMIEKYAEFLKKEP